MPKRKPYINKKNEKPSLVVVSEPCIETKNQFFSFSNIKFQRFFIVSLALVLYVNTLNMDYALDDTLMIIGNKFTKNGVHGIKDIFTTDAFVGFLGQNNLLPGGRYRPLSQVMFAIEYQLFGPNPFIGHLVNLILYALCCLFLFNILLKIFNNFKSEKWFKYFAFIATIIFTAHPLHTEVVANIKGRDELMCLIGSLSLIYFGIKYIDNHKIINLILMFIIFILSVLSKESAITFIAIIPLCIYFYKKTPVKEYFLVLSPLILGFIIYFIIRVAVIGAKINYLDTELLNNPFVGASVSQKYATIMLTWWKYLWLTLFPYTLTHDYYPKQIPIVGWDDFRVILAFIIYLSMAVFAIITLKKKNIYSFGILFFLITFSISSNLVFNIGAFMNERFLFTPLIGFAIIVSYFLNNDFIKLTKSNIKTVAYIVTVIVLLYGIKTVTRNRVWKDDLTLFTTDVLVSTNSTKCNTSAGGKLLEKADSTKDEAEKQRLISWGLPYLEKAVEIYPLNFNAWLLLGNAYTKQMRFEDGFRCYDNCHKINQGSELPLHNMLYLAQKSFNDKSYQMSIKSYNYLLKLKPDNAEYLYSIGVDYKSMQKFDSAVFFINESIKLKPDYADAYARLGEIYGQNFNNLDKALEFLLKAVELDPKNESALENIGIIYGLKKNFKLSLEYFNKALLLEPDKQAIYSNMGQTYMIMGDKVNAAKYFSKANELKK